jgi:hypothetical protein
VKSDVTDLLSTINYPLNVLPLQGKVAGSCYALPRWGEGKKRILDPGTLKKIKIPLIYYSVSSFAVHRSALF